jgi:hypothetical protein
MDERYDMMRSVTDGRWLYIRNFRPDLPYVQPLEYMFRARGYQSWAREARAGRLTKQTERFWGQKPSEELYDLDHDPDNVENLASDPKCREVLDKMRNALRAHTIDIVDNGFAPEGSSLEGYEASRAGLYPIAKVFDLAVIASERNSADMQKLVAALADPCEAIRWWAAQGCAMLGKQAAPAETVLVTRLRDSSQSVRVAVAEALARMGRTDIALAELETVLEDMDHPMPALQAANVLDRLGESARTSLPALKRALGRVNASNTVRENEYLQRILTHAIDVLEGKTLPLAQTNN